MALCAVATVAILPPSAVLLATSWAVAELAVFWVESKRWSRKAVNTGKGYNRRNYVVIASIHRMEFTV